MRRHWFRVAMLTGTAALLLAVSAPAHAFHFYRSTDGGCSAASGARTDDPIGTVSRGTASAVVGHNVFRAGLADTGLSVGTLVRPREVHVKAGGSIKWTWNSAHCHSVTSSDFVGTTRLFDSGLLYPTTPPESLQAVPGLFEYPMLDNTPTLSFTHTFNTPGTYNYFCVHHASIGMNGVVVVWP